MFNILDEFIDPDDIVEAQAEYDAYTMEEKEVDGTSVLDHMRSPRKHITETEEEI